LPSCALTAPVRFSLFGGVDYTARAQSVIARSKLCEAINACSLSLVEAIALLHHADLFVGTDSGPMNLAVAVGTPSFALFGVNPVLSYSKFIYPLTPPGGPAPGGNATDFARSRV
jgi:heptosyltransferase II